MKKKHLQGLPINLLLTNRKCLVVGGGKVALHKINHLLKSGAIVHVVSLERSEEIEQLIKNHQIEHEIRPFEESDVKGMMIVFAATNVRPINRAVLDACRAENILCCCADGNWSDADFTTPAITRYQNITISVSSNGRNCRQAKMVKNSLTRHLEMISSAELVIIGTDHNHLSVEEREPYHLTGPRFFRTGFMMMQLWGIHEFMLLNTCNRIELIAVVSKEAAENQILRHALGFSSLKEDKFYFLRGEKAFEQLCLVTAGILSQTPGENHITSQIKEALKEAVKYHWASNMIQEWISKALQISKQIKNEVAPLLKSCEIEDLTLKYLKNSIPNLNQSTLMILGAGIIGKGLINDAADKVKRIIWCYHINCPEIPTKYQDKVELCTFNSIKDHITDADTVISATEAPGHVLHLGHAPFFNQEKPVKLIDLGMPRNIDPELETISPDLSVIDLDSLKYWHRNELTDMDQIFTKSREIIDKNHAIYEKITNSFQPPSKN